MTINHDCYPNCNYSYINGKLECRVIRSVEKGEELTVTYIDPMDTHYNRHTNITSTRHFECSCRRCEGYVKYCRREDAAKTDVVEELDDDLFARLALLSDTSVGSGYPDALFSGLYCERCGPGGVMTRPVDSPTSAYSCRQCMSNIPNATGQLVLTEAVNNLGILMKEAEVLLGSGSDPMKCAAMIEKWLKTFEGKAKSSGSALQPSAAGIMLFA